MKVALVSFPYLGMSDIGDVERTWAHMRLSRPDGGAPDRRAVKRIVRIWIKRFLGRTVHTVELRAIMRRVVYE